MWSPGEFACVPSNLTKVRAISRGAHSLVWLVRMRGVEGNISPYFALKAISKERVAKVGEGKHVLREKKALRALQPHPFIVALHSTFQDSNTLYFLLSLVLGGDLRGVLLRLGRRRQAMPEPHAVFYSAILAMALGHLHDRGYAYRDLKPENVLIDSQGYCVLCDFGTAVHLGRAGRAMTVVGTWEYAAPEQLEESGSTMASDWWSFGVVLLECLSGEVPFSSGDANDPIQVLRAIRKFEAVSLAVLARLESHSSPGVTTERFPQRGQSLTDGGSVSVSGSGSGRGRGCGCGCGCGSMSPSSQGQRACIGNVAPLRSETPSRSITMMGGIVAAGARRGGERANEQPQPQPQPQPQQQQQQQQMEAAEVAEAAEVVVKKEDARLASLGEPPRSPRSTPAYEDCRLAHLSEPAKALICTLLQTNEHARWALARHDGLRSWRFFGGLGWDALLARRVPPPVVPALLGDADTRNFSHCSLAHVGLDEQVGVPLDAGALDTALELEVLRSASEGPSEALRSDMGGGGGDADLGLVLDGCARPSKRAKEDSTSGDSWEGF